MRALGLLPALPPVLDGIDTAAHATGDLRVTPGGMLMREQKNPRPLDFRKWGSVTGTELLQMSLLLQRELDRILGQRSWHKDSPPDQAHVGRIVICQDLAHVKPATYFLRAVLSRKMMFQTVGHRPRTQQRVRLGATPDGKLVSLHHDYVYHRSILDAHHEDCGETTPFQYSVPNLRVTFGRARRHVGAAADMRGPGAVPGVYAIESAMNELADALKMDPVRLRVINEPKIDEGLRVPFSSRHLLECL